MLLITDQRLTFAYWVLVVNLTVLCVHYNGTVEPVDGDPSVADADAGMGLCCICAV
jgi:hypothetical protein